MPSHNNRIAKNTGLLYLRLILTMLVSLYTSRVVLEILGVEDFGIYSVVGGIVIMFGFFNEALSSTTQRFLSFEMGRSNSIQLKNVFSSSITIHFIISLIVLILAETIGLWFLNNQLEIPNQRMSAANWVYQFSVLTFVINILSTPYNAAIIAHERMSFYAYLSIVESLLKLIIVFILSWGSLDKLKLYATLIFVVSVCIRILYQYYCKKSFNECRYQFMWDVSLMKRLTIFSGWNLFGSIASITNNQGIGFLLNIFFGVTINAAVGIANQVNSAVYQFVANFQMAFRPQIIKFYAEKNRDEMLQLVFRSSRFSYYLMLILSFPLLFQTEEILFFWLRNVPDRSIIFTKLILINSLSYSISGPLMTLAQATGKIRGYQLIVGGILISVLPLSYLILRLGLDASYVYITMILFTFISLIARLLILERIINFPTYTFLKEVISRIAVTTFISYGIIQLSSVLISNISSDLFQLILKLISQLAITVIIIFLIGIDKNERFFLIAACRKLCQMG